MATQEEIVTLHRYWIWQNRLRMSFDETLNEAPENSGLARTFTSDQYIFMSLWYAGLYVVIEGWQELDLTDTTIDRMLQDTAKVSLLRRWRNAIYHYQRDYVDNRVSELFEATDQGIVSWIRTLNQELGRFFLDGS